MSRGVDLVPASSAEASLPQTYWNTAAETYEHDFTETLVGKLWRDSVWREVDLGLLPGTRVLELNCGTGIDALHLASRGVSVVACDISSRMIELAHQGAANTGFTDLVDFRVLPTEQLGSLQAKELFDGAFSNFSGLNCVKDLSQTRRDLAALLKPGSRVFLCMLGRFMPWEILRYGAQRNWTKAFQKLRRNWIQVTGSGVEVRLYSRKEIAKLFAPDFRLRSWKGIGIAVPPAYMDHWARNFPKTMRGLSLVDRVISRAPIFRNWGGCILYEFERTIQ
jgi:2-polyprenyl-3-methyl-5-hydroxy-6-metoxy-1,4-benzoquinol methylase